MRYVTVNSLTEGMILGKPFYGRFGQLMLRENMALTDTLISKIRELQYSGLYIKDSFSEGIEVEDVIADELRHNTASAVQRLMVDVEESRTATISKNMSDISRLLNQIIDEVLSSNDVIINLIDLKIYDLYTYQHSVNVCVLSCVIGAAMDIPPAKMFELALAAILHDVGKTFISKKILDKPGKLTPEEFEEIKKHSFFGYEFIKKHFYSYTGVFASVLQHHERYDGTGYPLGKKGENIPLFARIIAVADVFDSTTSSRPYGAPILPSEAYEYILGNSGRHFHPEVVEVFIKKVAPFPLGLTVRLSNGLQGLVFHNYHECLLRPKIKLLPLPGQAPGEDRYLDLYRDPNNLGITIQEVLA